MALTSKFRGKALAAAMSYAVAAGCLYWVFHNLDFRQLLHSFAEVNWWWVPPAIVLDLLVYVLAGWEWQILLRPAGRLSALQTTQAVFAGRLANDVVPFHIGYIIRIYLVSRWGRIGIASVAPSLLVERLFDGIWLALGIGLAAMFFPVPPRIAMVAEIWVGIIIFGLIAGAFIVFRKPGSSTGPNRHLRRWPGWARTACDALNRALEQVREIGRSGVVPVAFGISFLKFAAQCFAFLFLLWGYHFGLPLPAELAVFLIAYVGLSMPSTPASIGVFQVFCIAGLEMFHVSKSAAAAFSLVAFAVLAIPLSIAGFFALAQSGLTLGQVCHEANGWTKR